MALLELSGGACELLWNVCVTGPLQWEPLDKTRAGAYSKVQEAACSPLQPALQPTANARSLPLTFHCHATDMSGHIVFIPHSCLSFLWLCHLFSKTLAGQRETGSGLAGFKAVLEATKAVVKSQDINLRRGRGPAHES